MNKATLDPNLAKVNNAALATSIGGHMGGEGRIWQKFHLRDIHKLWRVVEGVFRIEQSKILIYF